MKKMHPLILLVQTMNFSRIFADPTVEEQSTLVLFFFFLQNFYKTELNKEEMYIRYIHKLYDLHLKAQNFTGNCRLAQVGKWAGHGSKHDTSSAFYNRGCGVKRFHFKIRCVFYAVCRSFSLFSVSQPPCQIKNRLLKMFFNCIYLYFCVFHFHLYPGFFILSLYVVLLEVAFGVTTHIPDFPQSN